MKNRYSEQGEVTLINVWCVDGWRDRYESLAVVVDTADLPLLLSHSITWYAQKARAPFGKYYVFSKVRDKETGRHRTISLHRLLMGEPVGMDVHHKDNDGLNCRRSNLEVLTHQENHRARKQGKDWEAHDKAADEKRNRAMEKRRAREVVKQTGFTRQYIWQIRNGKARNAQVEQLLAMSDETFSLRVPPVRSESAVGETPRERVHRMIWER